MGFVNPTDTPGQPLNVIYAEHIKQLINVLTGQRDGGALTLLGQVSSPGTAPTVTLSAGPLNGSYQWGTYWITGIEDGTGGVSVTGRTTPSPYSAAQTLANQQGAVSIAEQTIPTGVVGWGVVRNQAGGATWYKVPGSEQFINTVGAMPTSFVDNASDANLVTVAPATNTTGVTLGTGGNLEVNGGTLTMGNGTSNMVNFAAYGNGAPGLTLDSSAGAKINLWDLTNVAMGIGTDSETVWYSSYQYHKWYSQNASANAPVDVMTLDGSGNLTVIGNITSQNLIIPNDTAVQSKDTSDNLKNLLYFNTHNQIQLGDTDSPVVTTNNTLDDGSGNLIAHAGITSQGYFTNSTGASYAGDWTLIGEATINTQYQDVNSIIDFFGYGSGGGEPVISMFWRVKQQNAFGQLPYVDLVMIAGEANNGYSPESFMAVCTTNTTSETIVQLYVNIKNPYDTLSFNPRQVSGSGGSTQWYSNQSFFTAPPSGTMSVSGRYPNSLRTVRNTLDDGSGGMSIGSGNGSFINNKAYEIGTDTRTTNLTYANGQLTQVEVVDPSNGNAVISTTTLTYSGSQLTQVQEVAGGHTVTSTLNYTNGQLTSVTKAVS